MSTDGNRTPPKRGIPAEYVILFLVAAVAIGFCLINGPAFVGWLFTPDAKPTQKQKAEPQRRAPQGQPQPPLPLPDIGP